MDKTDSKGDNKFISGLRDILLQNLDRQDFNVSVLASSAGLSPSELYKKVKKETGKSVTEFVRDIRLEEALKTLQQTDLTAAEVAYKVGFNSPAYFNNCFKSKYGITPGEAGAYRSDVTSSNERRKSKAQNFSNVSHFFITHKYSLGFSVALVGICLWLVFSSQNTPSSKDETLSKQIIPSTEDSDSYSLAVLPLENWTGDAQYNYICYGVSDAIVARLIELDLFDRITPLNSIIRSKDSVYDLKALGQLYQVDHLLYGNVQKAGSKIKFSVFFIDIQPQSVLWSKEFVRDWEIEQLFEMQSEIAEQLAKTLEIDQTGLGSGIFTMSTSSNPAYDSFLKGIYESSKSTKRSWELSKHYFEEAIALDSGFVNPYIALADVWLYNGMIWAYCSQEEAKKNGIKYLDLAKEKGADPKKIFKRLRDIEFYYDLTVPGLVDQLSALDFIDNEEYSFDIARKTGELEVAKKIITKGLQQDPINPTLTATLAQIEFFQGNHAVANQLLESSFRKYKHH